MKIAVASGKGGTGKTTVAVNLALTFASKENGPVQIIDCDVEEPNVHLFLKSESTCTQTINVLVPRIDKTLCDGCGKCSDFCAFHAIVSTGTTAMVFEQMCHSCGGCRHVCPRGAITEVPHRIGQMSGYHTSGIDVLYGSLDVGVAMAPPMIRRVKKEAAEKATVIIDAPPGTSCPVIATIRDCDGVLLVTEPTPFGLHDLTIATQVVAELKIPFGVIINRADSGDSSVRNFCEKAAIPILLEIPDDRRVAQAYSMGLAAVNEVPGYRDMFIKLVEMIPAALRIQTTNQNCNPGEGQNED